MIASKTDVNLIGNIKKTKRKFSKALWLILLVLNFLLINACSSIPARKSHHSECLRNINTICLKVWSTGLPAKLGLSTEKVYGQTKYIFEQNGFNVLPGVAEKDYRPLKVRLGRKALKRSYICKACDASLVIILRGSDKMIYKKGAFSHQVPGQRIGNRQKIIKYYKRVPTNRYTVNSASYIRFNVRGQNVFHEKFKYTEKVPRPKLNLERKKSIDFIEINNNEKLRDWIKTIKKYSSKE